MGLFNHKKRATYEDFLKLREEYQDEADIIFHGRQDMIEFLEREYHITDPDKFLSIFEKCGRDFDKLPTSALNARIMVLMDFDHYDKKRLALFGGTIKGTRHFRKYTLCAQFFNNTKIENIYQLKKSNDGMIRGIKRVDDAAKRCKKAIKNAEKAVKYANKVAKQ